MVPPPETIPLDHGGDLDAARKLFPGAPEPFLDLSTAINPHRYPYPIRELLPEDFARLPAPEDLKQLRDRAATFYAVPSPDNVVAGPGGQALMALAARLVPAGHATIVAPTYAEHARTAALAGHAVTTVSEPDELGDADLAIAVNPNNPDGRVFSKEALLRVAKRQRPRGGLLIVDEAFMDAGPLTESLSFQVDEENVVVVRSFGKFFGLAGLRLSFALAPRAHAARLRASLGPWPVSGPALLIGKEALWDSEWIRQTRMSLAKASRRLDDLLVSHGMARVGGTELFTLISHPDAQQVFERLGRAGIFVRRFADNPYRLRFGLPGSEEAWERLEAALDV